MKTVIPLKLQKLKFREVFQYDPVESFQALSLYAEAVNEINKVMVDTTGNYLEFRLSMQIITKEPSFVLVSNQCRAYTSPSGELIRIPVEVFRTVGSAQEVADVIYGYAATLFDSFVQNCELTEEILDTLDRLSDIRV